MWNIAKVEEALRTVQAQLLDGTISEEKFMMDCILDVRSCGTVGCIGGWMLHNDHVKTYHRPPTSWLSSMGRLDAVVCGIRRENNQRGLGLYRLFFNWPEKYDDEGEYALPTPAEGAAAIQQWLDGSERPWGETA